MPRATDPPKNVGQLIDQIERIREELLTIQRAMEEMEPKKDGSNGPKKM
jgi:hypothetical protein